MAKVRDIQPPDCYVKAQTIAADVDLIRQEMGRPTDKRPAATVSGAAPREVYFQALALFRKADRLCYEITGDQIASVPHAPPIAEIRPGDVLNVLDAAHREIEETKARLGIRERGKAPARDASKVPSDVFGAVVAVNRQLNLLLERPFAPGDVFQQVSLAAAYAQRVAALLGGEAPADLPAFKRRQRPYDCYTRLSTCVAKLQTVTRALGLDMLTQAPPPPGDEDQVVPADVYDMASLVLSELAFVHAHHSDANPPYPFEANLPGRKLPAHVMQLAGLVEKQIDVIAKLARARGKSLAAAA